MREPGFYWVRSSTFGKRQGGSNVCVAELWESRWWFSADTRTPLETHPEIEVLSECLVPPEAPGA